MTDEIPVVLNVFMAPPIRDESWLHQARFDEFRIGYAYASHKQNAISGLSKITPEEAFYVHLFIQRGIEIERNGHQLCACGNPPQHCNMDGEPWPCKAMAARLRTPLHKTLENDPSADGPPPLE